MLFLAFFFLFLAPGVFLKSANWVSGYNDIMMVGGYNGDFLEDVEIVSTNGTSTCRKPADYPFENDGMVGTFLHGMALVCGGFTSDCFAYDFDTNVWLATTNTLSTRQFASAVMLNDSLWWITGGFAGSYLKTTELYNAEANSFSPFLDLPVATDHHVILKVDETHFFLCCGVAMSGKSYMLDLETEMWTETSQSQHDHAEGFAGMTTQLLIFRQKIMPRTFFIKFVIR